MHVPSSGAVRIVLAGAVAALSLGTQSGAYADEVSCDSPGVYVFDDAVVLAGPGPYPVGYNGMTAVEVGDCGGISLSASGNFSGNKTGAWSCKKRPWWRDKNYACSGRFQHNGQQCDVEWVEDRIDGSPWDDSSDEITWIRCV